MKEIMVVIGAGAIGQAIARRVSQGKTVLLADLNSRKCAAAAQTLRDAGFTVETSQVDVSSRQSIQHLVQQATALGVIKGVIHSAGVSPSQASPATILQVDLYGTAVVLEEFGPHMASGGCGIVIASQSGHRLPALTVEQNEALAITPTEDLLSLPFLQNTAFSDPLLAYQYAKRGNALRVMAEATKWGQRGARVNSISPGIIFTPLANDELNGPRGAGYRNMLAKSPVGRGGTADEVAALAALIIGPEGGYISGSDFLMDGGVTASYWYGDLKP
ncbi:SDR family oxidoreductase [Pantoea sp. JGM49]|jgi:Dehydrogenases with different specificities (related to short-chain alcohol dehydrogenases)|uniref:SDR family oxidoreductase n=1 Tax=unclassified Pantoea TaxID=2630326 RepID=UPI00132B57E0|nr:MULTISPECIES: SDR family oxidoreductase [unclassified Pantoea]MBS0882274.1 SDR family oxidoreductase [Pantoea sp. JGM49]MXP55269.1 SDR family oxidoreductase [Pantoea sp. Seng]MXP59418.1 SDR family oxidoreductase [Pantoea sp. Taur]